MRSASIWVKRLILLAVVLLAPVAIGSTAHALSINFTDGSWDNAHSLNSYSHASGVDLLATGGNITVNYIGGPSGDNSGNDGLGIGDDEITQGGGESLRISFSSAVTLERVYITDLFKEGPLNSAEIGLYSINGGTYNAFSSIDAPNGALTLNIFNPDVNYITFKGNNDLFSDYSVKGLKYSVPEPSTVLLLGLGFLIFATLIRKKNQASRSSI